MRYLVILSLLGLLLLKDVESGTDRVLLRDVSALTLREGAKTTGRRSAPQSQLKCIGGTAGCSDKSLFPRVVQCTNQGFDGIDVQWECKAEMDDAVKFGQITVSCEGYAHPDDPFILVGSCGLEYELEWRAVKSSGSKSARGGHSSWRLAGQERDQEDETGKEKNERNEDSIMETAGSALSIIFIAGVILYMCYYSGGGDGSGDGRRRGFFGGGFDGGPGGGGPGYGPPPSYDDSTGRKYRQQTSYGFAQPQDPLGAGGGAGFWTGLGLGGLGGYFMGRQGGATNHGGAYQRRGYGMDDSAFHGADRPSTSSGGTSESTAFGGTRRR